MGGKHDAEHHPSRRAKDGAHLRMTAEMASRHLRMTLFPGDIQTDFARRATHLRTPNPVQPLFEKYSALFLTQITSSIAYPTR
jgi:hypothetical protein